MRVLRSAARNNSVSRVYGRGGKRPLVLCPGSQAANGLPGISVPSRDRPRPCRPRSTCGVDQVSRGEEVRVSFRCRLVVCRIAYGRLGPHASYHAVWE